MEGRNKKNIGECITTNFKTGLLFLFPSEQGVLAMMTVTARNTSLKINTCATVTTWRLSHLFRIYNVGEEPYNWIGLTNVKLNTQN